MFIRLENTEFLRKSTQNHNKAENKIMDFTDYIVIKPWILEMKTYNIFRLVKIFHKGK